MSSDAPSSSNETHLDRALKLYLGDAKPTRIEKISTGHIHGSWRIDLSDAPTNRTPTPSPASLFLQQLNTTVFTDPEAVMHNIAIVTSFLKDNMARSGYDSLALIPTASGDPYLHIENTWWRAFEFKHGLESHHILNSPDMAFEAGKAFATFARTLEKLDPSILRIPIQKFHSLSWRVEQLRSALLSLPNRFESVPALKSFMSDIESLVQQAQDQVRILTPLEKAWTSGELPTRITHNDSKLNNLLFDAEGKARCVVDLDTVMPGIVHFDIGDSLRSMSVNLAEGDPNTQDLQIQDEFERQYFEGYTDGDWLTKTEHEFLPYAAPYMACIMGVRFLTDYIEGNRYFSIDYPSHNLTRATNQLTLTQLFLKKNGLD